MNSQYGFTFNVCNDSDFELVENNGSSVVALVGPVLRDFKHDIRISVILFQIPKKITLDDFLTERQAAAKANLKNFAILNETDTTIAGLPAKISHSSFTIATNDNEINYRITVAAFIKDNIVYAIQYETDAEIYEDHVQCFNLVLSSFKFN